MYSPDHYREDRLEVVLPLIERYSFATLITVGGSQISHLPFVPLKIDGRVELLSHMARANPHWQELQKLGKAKVLFHGPHAYVSPSWYTPAPGNVPTWNYAVVHAVGDFVVVDEPNQARAAMETMVGNFESGNGTDWKIPDSSAAIEGLMKGIVVFRVTNVEFEAKLKLSQKHSLENRHNVVEALGSSDSEDALAVADLMKKT